jgi:hypothetical protein
MKGGKEKWPNGSYFAYGNVPVVHIINEIKLELMTCTLERTKVDMVLGLLAGPFGYRSTATLITARGGARSPSPLGDFQLFKYWKIELQTKKFKICLLKPATINTCFSGSITLLFITGLYLEILKEKMSFTTNGLSETVTGLLLGH